MHLMFHKTKGYRYKYKSFEESVFEHYYYKNEYTGLGNSSGMLLLSCNGTHTSTSTIITEIFLEPSFVDHNLPV